MRIIGRIIAILAVITGTAAAAPLLSDAQTRTALAAMSAPARRLGSWRLQHLCSVWTRQSARPRSPPSFSLTCGEVRSGRPEMRDYGPGRGSAARLTSMPQPPSTKRLATESWRCTAGQFGTARTRLCKSESCSWRVIAALPLRGDGLLFYRVPKSEVLRARLAFEDNITGLSDAEALKHFQARHGLTQDGTLGLATLSALNIPASARADTIAANMERWRWLPRQLEADRIVINVADARLDLFLGGNQVLTSRVIVGKPATRTPILRADGAGVTVNPPWTVPASIAAREILPKLKRNPAYLVSQDMVLLDGPAGDPQGLHVNWRAIPAGHFPYKLRQHPGAQEFAGPHQD